MNLELNKIHHGDCLELMKDIPDRSVNMILCDLPYGTTRNKWDVVIPLGPMWQEFERISSENTAIVLTATQPFTTELINSNRRLFKYSLVWAKTLPTGFLNAKKQPLRCHEDVLVFYKKQPVYNPQKTNVERKDIGRVRKNSGNWEGYNEFRNNDWQWKEDGTRYPTSVISISNWNGALFGNTDKATKHPTQKPVPLFEWLIKTYTNEGDLVLDNCIGSGTTAIACLKNNRNFIGMEKELDFVVIANNRINSMSEKEEPPKIIKPYEYILQPTLF